MEYSSGTQFIINTMEWSFSRLECYRQCPYEWYSKYIECNEGEENFFAEFGNYCHSIIEKYEKGEVSIFEISQVYKDGFKDAVKHKAPPNRYVDLEESYFNKGLDYFDNIDLTLDNFNILGIEKKVDFMVFGKKFTGRIDLLLQDKATGEIIITDHKSSRIKVLKNGKVSQRDAEHFQTFIRQLALYSIPVIEEYGRVDAFWWNMFKEKEWIKIPFKEEYITEAKQWVNNTILSIYKEKDFPCNPDFFYCWYLCSQRYSACPYKPQLISSDNK